MNIKTKFNLGDTVWRIYHDRRKEWVPCTGCNATGKVKLQDCELVTCPKCYGSAGKHDWFKAEWQVDEQSLTLGKVQVSIVQKHTEGEGDRASNYGHQKSGRIEQYMARETGIGTGQCYFSDKLFPTHEEAVTECGARNAKETTHV